MSRILKYEQIRAFEQFMVNDEKSKNTIDKYMRDIRVFMEYARNGEVSKAVTLAYKTKLQSKYAVSSANSMLAAMNSFLRFLGWEDCCVKQFKVQRQIYCPVEKELRKEDYIRLIKTAEKKENERLSLLIQTICGTGIRVSELQYITAEAVRKGEAVVSCKGKIRTIFIVNVLRKKLIKYMKDRRIYSGAVFITKSGKPLDRSNIWREMKGLCKEAEVASEKVFPHNLRHLFARTFYEIEKDIVKLGDLLGHTNINTTRIYIIATGSEHKRKLEHMKLII